MSSLAASHVVVLVLEIVTATSSPVPDSLVPVLVAFASGAVGMSIKNVFDSIMSDENEGDGDELGGDDLGGGGDGGGLMSEEGDDDLDDLGGLGGGDDDFGGF